MREMFGERRLGFTASALMRFVCIRCNSYALNLEKLEFKSCSTELLQARCK